MAQIQPTTTITVDGNSFEVANMSTEVQQMIVYLDNWRQDEADQASELLKTRAALRDIQNTLLQQIQQEQEAAKKAAEEAEGLTEPLADEAKPVEGTLVE